MMRQITQSAGRKRRTAVFAVLASLALLVSATPASASNFASRYADNGNHYYAYVYLESYTTTAASWGRDRVNATDMDTFYDGSCKQSTDVCVYDANYTGTWWATHYGSTGCAVTMSGGKCDRFTVKFDTSNLSGYSTTWLRRAGCHEWGHTTGLKHIDGMVSSNSCMYSAINNSKQHSYFAGHDTSHVNGRY